MEEKKSCLCCGKVGEPGAWLMNEPSVYVCRRCHRLGNNPEFKASNEEEGDAYTFGFFDGVDEGAKHLDALLSACKGLLKAHRITVARPPETVEQAESQLDVIRNAVAAAEAAIADVNGVA